MPFRNIVIGLLILASASLACTAQDSLSLGKKEKKEKKIALVVLPVIGASPANGFLYGVMSSAGWYLGDKSSTTISNAYVAFIYTTLKQSLNLIKSNIFLRDDKWVLKGDWRVFFTNQSTFGLGTGPPSLNAAHAEQSMKFNFIRLHETALRRYRDTRLFAGVGYQLDIHYSIADSFAQPMDDSTIMTSNDSYSNEYGFNPNNYTLSGISLNVLYDSRDNPIFPTHGRYAFASFRMNPEFLGSVHNATTLWLEYRDYFRLSKKKPRHLIAVWTYASLVTSGAVPYMDLPAIGWDQYGRSGRGYKQGRWRGYDLIYGEAEWRFPLPSFIKKLPDLLGGVAFVNATTTSDHSSGTNLFEYIEPAAGIGLRVMLNQKSKANVAIDYAFGNYESRGFYLDLTEAF